MKFTTVVLPLLVAAASPAAAFTRIFLDGTVGFVSDAHCHNIAEYTSNTVNTLSCNDGLECTIYSGKDCAGTSVKTQGSYSVGQAPEKLSALTSFWCYPEFW